MINSFKPDYAQAIVRPSTNCQPRTEARKPQFIILHYTGTTDSETAERMFVDPKSKSSAHYLVREDGTVIQFVQEDMSAWHAGESCWHAVRDVNAQSIGIKVVNAGPVHDFPTFPDAQIDALVHLCQNILARHDIAARDVVGYGDIAPSRRIDPGPAFPWATLAAHSVGHYVTPTVIQSGRFMARGEQGVPVEAFQSMLALYGYDVGISSIFDERTETVTKAFQRHFRPMRVDGVADFSTVDTLYRLLGSSGAL